MCYGFGDWNSGSEELLSIENTTYFHGSCPEHSSSSTPSPWKGRLSLSFSQRNGETYISHSYAQAPLAIQSPFYPEGREVCHCIVLNPPGGVAGNDILQVDLKLDAASKALITTPAAGKLYKTNGMESRQIISVHVGAGASLEWLPQGTIVFDGAVSSQEMRVVLDPGAIWIGWDITRFGRTYRGERFLRGVWRSSVEVWQGGKPLWIDRQKLEGGTRLLDSPYGLFGQPVVAQLVFLGQDVSADMVNSARSAWNPEESKGEVGVSRLQCGMLCRYRGSSTMEAHQCFSAVWALLRRALLGRESCPPRIWNT